MVSLIKRRENGKILYYLKYSSRNSPTQKYIGTTIPNDIKQITNDFEVKSFRKDKTPLLNKIKQKLFKSHQVVRQENCIR